MHFQALRPGITGCETEGLEFRFFEGRVLLGDEISPDTCRLWDKESLKKLDKDRFRRDLGKEEEAYQEVVKRIEAELK